MAVSWPWTEVSPRQIGEGHTLKMGNGTEQGRAGMERKQREARLGLESTQSPERGSEHH